MSSPQFRFGLILCLLRIRSKRRAKLTDSTKLLKRDLKHRLSARILYNLCKEGSQLKRVLRVFSLNSVGRDTKQLLQSWSRLTMKSSRQRCLQTSSTRNYRRMDAPSHPESIPVPASALIDGANPHLFVGESGKLQGVD